MCPLRWVLALLSIILLLVCLSQLMFDADAGAAGGLALGPAPGSLAARLAALRRRHAGCARFTATFFTGELLWALLAKEAPPDELPLEQPPPDAPIEPARVEAAAAGGSSLTDGGGD